MDSLRERESDWFMPVRMQHVPNARIYYRVARSARHGYASLELDSLSLCCKIEYLCSHYVWAEV